MDAREARRAITPIAEAQRGLITTGQAARVGVPRLDMSRLEAAGDLERLSHGVYRVAGAVRDEYTDVYAQWLALDPGRTAAERVADRAHMIAVSHRSAAAIYDIGDLPANVDTYTASYRKQSQRAGVRVHTGTLDTADVRVERGMLVTTPERTLADLRRTEPDSSHVADALADALDARRVSGASASRALGPDVVERMLASKGLDSASLVRALADAQRVSHFTEEAANES
jgi:predicted transcriptional regulator of viral defense system